MSDIVIDVNNIGKRYNIGGFEPYYSLRDSLSRSFSAPFRYLSRIGKGKTAEEQQRADDEIFWALRDVSFQVKRGEVLGIIGRNGAGKSTLLKILSRITSPTEGQIAIAGRVGSLLEVGTGFHPELSGRDNIYLNGAILGMKKREIKDKFDEIVDFSGIGKFIDTPVKRYSSGMYVRLAFGVAAHLDPEILLVDEVLAVGDVEFQKKCLGKMGDVVRGGRTVLFISHNMGAIRTLCNRVLVLDKGEVAIDGSADAAIKEYIGLSILHRDGERIWNDLGAAPGNDLVRMTALRSRKESGEVCAEFDLRDPVFIEVEYMVLKEGAQLSVSIEFIDSSMTASGKPLFHSFDNYIKGSWGDQAPARVGLHKAVCEVPGDLFHKGDITLNVRIFMPPGQPEETVQVREIEALSFRIIDSMKPGGVRGSYPYDWGDPVIRPILTWQSEFKDV